MKPILASLCLLLALPAMAEEGGDAVAQRARIEAERARVNALFVEEEKACRGRFAVHDCTAAAKARQREALKPLRQQEIELNAIERERKTAERLRELEEKRSPQVQEEAARKRTEAQKDAKAREQRAAEKAATRRQPEPEAATPAVPAASAVAGPKSGGTTAAEAEARRREHEQRLAEAREHKAKVLKRQEERKKPPAQPLPVPP